MNEVFVPAWNIYLSTAKPVEDSLKAVGIRAHSFHPEIPENRFPVRIVREMEEPFERVSEFRYEGQTEGSPAIWWRYSREIRPPEAPEALGVRPEDVLPLYN